MKRILLILTTLLQLAVLIGCWSGTGGQPGDIYRKYASQPGLAVAQVTDFELCDTVSVDVAMPVADNDGAWQQIVAGFEIRIDSGSTLWPAPIDHPSVRTSWGRQPGAACGGSARAPHGGHLPYRQRRAIRCPFGLPIEQLTQINKKRNEQDIQIICFGISRCRPCLLRGKR